MLAFFEARIAAWVTAKESYLKAVSLGQLGDMDLSAISTTGASRPSIELPIGALRGKSLPEAIRLYLAAGRRKQTNKEIAIGVRQAGLETTAGSFEANVAAALYRLKKAGIVLRFKDGWDLAEHYPDHIRNKLENGGRQKGAAKKRPVRQRSKSRAEKSPGGKAGEAKLPESQSLDRRIMEFFKTIPPNVSYSPKDAAKAVGEVDSKAVGMAFARLVRFGKVTKDENGLYRAA